MDPLELSDPASQAVLHRVSFDARCTHERAKARQLAGDPAGAEQDFTALLERDPSNAHAFFRRAFARKSLKSFLEAADDFERAKALQPGNEFLAVNYLRLKDAECIVLCEPGEEPPFGMPDATSELVLSLMHMS